MDERIDEVIRYAKEKGMKGVDCVYKKERKMYWLLVDGKRVYEGRNVDAVLCHIDIRVERGE